MTPSSNDNPTMVRLAVDFEFESRTWWDGGGQDLWEGITEGFEESSVVLEESLAQSWLAAAGKIDGWDDGHEYAPHPVTVGAIDEDEDV